MLARASVWCLWVAAAMFLVVGVVAFAFPEWASTNFPWKVGPFLVMTIGGWCLGTAGGAIEAAAVPRLPRARGILAYLWLFGVGQALVVVVFLDKLMTTAPLAWPYLAGLAALVVSAAVGLVDILRRRPDLLGGGPTLTRGERAAALVFGLIVLSLVAGNLITSKDGEVVHGRWFPEEMTLFSVRAFAAFFLSVASSALVLLPRLTRYEAFHVLSRAGLYLIAPITLAALLHIDRFDVARPGTLIYLAAYLGVGAILVAVLVRDRRHPERWR